MDMNIRNVDDELMRKFKGKAITEGFTLREKIIRLMELDVEKKLVVQPIKKKGKKK